MLKNILELTDIRKIRATLSNYDFSKDLLNRFALFNFYFLLKKYGNKKDLEKILTLSEKTEYIDKIGRKYSDWKYIQTYGFLFSKSQIERIKSSLDYELTDDELEKIERSMIQKEGSISEYVQRKTSLVKDRINSEYKFIKSDPINFFPYKYLVDFQSSIVSRIKKDSIKLSFIYCLKNRSKRTLISIKTLQEAYQKYREKNNSIEIEIIIVEDLGNDLFVPDKESSYEAVTEHYVINTGKSWTRSGTLNFGIRKSSKDSDVVVFCDVDFLYPDDFFIKAESEFLAFDFNKQIMTINCFETESHWKGSQLHSEASPYGYMWFVDRKKTMDAGGFSEEFEGHGFEDRDFQLKMTKKFGMKIVDSLSCSNDIFVLHFSHNVRTGSESRLKNKEILQKHLDENFSKNTSPNWGEYPILSHTLYSKRSIDKIIPWLSSYDVVFLAHNYYHAWTYKILQEELESSNITSILLSPLPEYQDEGVEKFCLENKLPFLKTNQFLDLGFQSSALLVFNDWDKRVANPLVKKFKSEGLKTIGLIEGINDYRDVDTGRPRNAYRTVEYVLLPGAFDKENYFSDLGDKAKIVGIPRMRSVTKKNTRPSNPKRVLINANFTYGVLEEHREQWISDCVNACNELGLEYVISRHQADKGDYSGLNVTSKDFYSELTESDLLLSRFSSCILEALVIKVPVVYYNYGFEQVYKFQNPKGAYVFCDNREDLIKSIEKTLNSEFPDSEAKDFLNEHAHFNHNTIELVTDSISEILKDN